MTHPARPLQNAQVSLFCHYRPVKISEIEGNQVRSKTAASYWLTRGYDLFSCACRNGKKGFQDRRFQPLTHSSVFYPNLSRSCATGCGRRWAAEAMREHDKRQRAHPFMLRCLSVCHHQRETNYSAFQLRCGRGDSSANSFLRARCRPAALCRS